MENSKIVEMLKSGKDYSISVRLDHTGDNIVAAGIFRLWAEKNGIKISGIKSEDKPIYPTWTDYVKNGIIPIGIFYATPFGRKQGEEDISTTERIAQVLDLPLWFKPWEELLTKEARNPSHSNGIPTLMHASRYCRPEYGGNLQAGFEAVMFYLYGWCKEQEMFFEESPEILKVIVKNIKTKIFPEAKINILPVSTSNPRASSFILSGYNRIAKVDCVVLKNPADNHLTIIGRRYLDMAKIAAVIRQAHNNGKIKIDLSSQDATADLTFTGMHHDVFYLKPETGDRVIIGRFGNHDHPGTKLSLEKVIEIVLENLELRPEKLH
jgi:hypothetical protein